jgi:hypothetical protein
MTGARGRNPASAAFTYSFVLQAALWASILHCTVGLPMLCACGLWHNPCAHIHGIDHITNR